MESLSQILAATELENPDGRPLYALPLDETLHRALERDLFFQLRRQRPSNSTAPAFVLWAAERIRKHFPGGQLTWDFIFEGLRLETNRAQAVDLVQRGLRWWQRDIRRGAAGQHRYLYSLMAEGGLPEALLMQDGLYRRVVKGLLADIEAEGLGIPDEVTIHIATRRVADLPQTFQDEDIIHLLAEFAVALMRLRAEVPADVPVEVLDRWLDKHRPDWEKHLPLRLSREAADSLIRPALRTERARPAAAGPLAWRALVRDGTSGTWRAVVRLAAEGALAKDLLPEAAGLRLRFLPIGPAAGSGSGSLVYSATPQEGGWELRRMGSRGEAVLPLALTIPLILGGYADGRAQGEVDIAPAMPPADEDPSFWTAAETAAHDDAPSELRPAGVPRTRGQRLWMLTAADQVPAAGEEVSLGDPQNTDSGTLWPVTGTGRIRVGERTWSVVTGTDEESPARVIIPQGQTLADWRLAGSGGHVFQGEPALWGQFHAAFLRPLHRSDVRRRPARSLMGAIAEWIEKDEVCARLPFVALPKDARLEIRETDPSTVVLRLEGFDADLMCLLAAGPTTARTQLRQGGGSLTLTVAGAPPGSVRLRLSCPVTGKILELSTPWPTRNGMILGPGDARLEWDTPLSVEALRDWRAIVPRAIRSEIQLRMEGRCIAIRLEGDTPLAVYSPLIRCLLAHGGPDAEVMLNIVTGGHETRRLAIRRYHDQTALTGNGSLWLGVGRQKIRMSEADLVSRYHTQGEVMLHAVDLTDPAYVERQIIPMRGCLDLPSILPRKADAVWLLQATLDGRVQRASVWAPAPMPSSRREGRIEQFVEMWQELATRSDRTAWQQQWQLIQAAMDGGDAGVLDQVQALARVPQAVVRLLLRVQEAELASALSLHMAAPIFWPALPVRAFKQGLAAEHLCLCIRYADVFDDPQEAQQEAAATLARRIAAILVLHAELAGHFGAALIQAGLWSEMPQDLLAKVRIPPSFRRLADLAQEMARRFDWLPSGVEGITPRMPRPAGLSGFTRYAQAVVDAPLVTAEIATGLRSASPKEALMLLNLRLLDPLYFDQALPLAISLVFDVEKKPVHAALESV